MIKAGFVFHSRFFNMPIPLAYRYEHNSKKTDFVFPRTPLTPQCYQPPVLEKIDLEPAKTRSKYITWMSDGLRHHFIAMLGEFVEILLFLFFAFTTAQIENNKPDTLLGYSLLSDLSLLQLLYISTGFGISLAVNAWISYRTSGGMFNPAVSYLTCFCLLQRSELNQSSGHSRFMSFRGLSMDQGCSIVVQIAGEIAAAALVSGLFPGPLVAQTNLGDGTTLVQGLFIEMMLTVELVFTILMLAVEKHRASYVAPIGIGLSLLLGHIVDTKHYFDQNRAILIYAQG